MEKHKFSPTSICNINEAGVPTVPNNPPEIVYKKVKRVVNKISSTTRGASVTVINAMSATSYFISPAEKE